MAIDIRYINYPTTNCRQVFTDVLTASCASENNPIFTSIEYNAGGLNEPDGLKCIFGEGENDYIDFMYTYWTNRGVDGFGIGVPNRYGRFRYPDCYNNDRKPQQDCRTNLRWYATYGTGCLFCLGDGERPANYYVAITSDTEGKPFVAIVGGWDIWSTVYCDWLCGCKMLFARDADYSSDCSTNKPIDSNTAGNINERATRPCNQIAAIPFIGRSGTSDVVYTTNAAMILKGPAINPYPDANMHYMNMWQTMEFEGARWLTNGYWMLKDEEL